MSAVHRTTLLAIVWGLLLSCTMPVGADSWTEEHLRIATQVELMKGHLISALENSKLGKIPLAQGHIGHALYENYTALAESFEKNHQELAQTLRETLTHLQGDSRVLGDIAACRREVEAAIQVLDRSLDQLIPADVRKAPGFLSAVLAHLLEEVKEDYDAAVQGGTVANLPEYQDAFGFLQRTNALAANLAGQLIEGDRRRMNSLLQDLEKAMPGIMPPSSPTTSEAVQKNVAALVEILRKSAER